MRIRQKLFVSHIIFYQHDLATPTGRQSLSTIPMMSFLEQSVRNLGFVFDSNLSVKQHIKTCKAAYIEIRRISSIRQYLTEDAAKTIVNSCILS